MSIFNNSIVPASAGGYEIDQSLRFNDDDSAYLSRTPASAGNRQTWTWSGWVKRGNLGTAQRLITTPPTNRFQIGFNTDDTLFTYDNNSGNTNTTSMVFRDVSTHYHILITLDTTHGTAAERHKFYVNGVELIDFGYSTTYALNAEPDLNNNVAHQIGTYNSGTSMFDGLLAEVNFIDGQALTPSSFGETDATYGHWKPIEYTGTYGTNGFYLDFSNQGSGMVASGGIVTTYGDYKVHTFNTSGIFEINELGSFGQVDVLVIGGGGGGGTGASSGGGGAGGFRAFPTTVVTQQSYNIIVGSGGSQNSNGNPSSFGDLFSSSGGGAGGNGSGYSGGSGGGGGRRGPGNNNYQYHHGAAGNIGNYTPSEGNSGADGSMGIGPDGWGAGGGGGGAGSGGHTPTSGSWGGNGGSGLANTWRTGSSELRAGGGGGGSGTDYSGADTGGVGGSGGGGHGDHSDYCCPAVGTHHNSGGMDAVINTGSGGGGAGYGYVLGQTIGGNGGSGIVIVRYKYK